MRVQTKAAEIHPMTDALAKGMIVGAMIWLAGVLPSEWFVRLHLDQPLTALAPRLILDLAFSVTAGALGMYLLDLRSRKHR